MSWTRKGKQVAIDLADHHRDELAAEREKTRQLRGELAHKVVDIGRERHRLERLMHDMIEATRSD